MTVTNNLKFGYIVFSPMIFARMNTAVAALYLIVTCLLTGYILSEFIPLLGNIVPQGPNYREYIIAFGQIAFQAIVLSVIAKHKMKVYLCTMMTISFCGALALWPAFPLHHHHGFGSTFITAYFFCVAGLMFIAHYVRMKKLGLGLIPTATWILYRVLVLTILLLIG